MYILYRNNNIQYCIVFCDLTNIFWIASFFNVRVNDVSKSKIEMNIKQTVFRISTYCIASQLNVIKAPRQHISQPLDQFSIVRLY
jgi:hypothetical protein